MARAMFGLELHTTSHGVRLARACQGGAGRAWLRAAILCCSLWWVLVLQRLLSDGLATICIVQGLVLSRLQSDFF